MINILNMQRCTNCSGTALRLFIQDLTGFIPRPDAKLKGVYLRKPLPRNNHARKSFSTTSGPYGLRQEPHPAQNDLTQHESENPTNLRFKSQKIDDKPPERPANEEHHQDANQKEPGSSQRIGIHDKAVQISIETASDRQQRRLLRKIERLQEGKYKGRMNSKFTKEQAIEHLGKRLSELDRPPGKAEQSEHIQIQTAAHSAPKSKLSPKKPVFKPTESTSHKKLSHTSSPKRETWQTQKNALTAKFGTEGWQPRKRLSPDALEGIRSLHASDPKTYSTPVLATQFAVTPEAIRRILKSKWKPSEGEAQDRAKRWERRGERKWKDMAALGVKPPKKWREKGIRVEEDGVGG